MARVVSRTARRWFSADPGRSIRPEGSRGKTLLVVAAAVPRTDLQKNGKPDRPHRGAEGSHQHDEPRRGVKLKKFTVQIFGYMVADDCEL